MKRTATILTTVTTLLLIAPPLAAQRAATATPRFFVTGSGHYTWSEGRSRGVTGGVGLGLHVAGFIAHIQAIDIGILTPTDDDPNIEYRWRVVTGGRECFIQGTAEVVDEKYCDGEWSIASAASLLYSFDVVGLPVMIGGGYRHGDNSTAFGTLAVSFSSMSDTFLLARTSVGSDFVQIGLDVGWPWR